MSAAIAYAQSGHLCLATLHANNSYHAMNRIISFYPLEVRPTLLRDLAAALQADHLAAPAAHARTAARVPAVEVLLNTALIAELIEKGDISGDQGSDGEIAWPKARRPSSRTSRA